MAKERLTEERKQQLEELYNNLHLHNFYSVLGVQEGAERAAIRQSYFSLSKLCHPDNYTEKDLGPHRTYMEKIFQACSKAYDVLSNEGKRKKYDAYLEKKKATAQYASDVMLQQASLHQVVAESRKPVDQAAEAGRTAPPPVQLPEEPPPPAGRAPSVPPSCTTPVRVSSVPPARLDEASREKHARRRRAWTRDSARRRLLGQVGSVKGVETAGKARSWIAQARKAREDGEVIQAINALKMALSFEAGNEEASNLLEELMQEASGELGQRYFEQATSELEFGEIQMAEVSIEKAVKLCPDAPSYLALAARILLENDGDLHKAYEHAQRAATTESRNGSHHLLLGKILLKAGLTARAKSALGKAIELNPKLKEARSLLARL